MCDGGRGAIVQARPDRPAGRAGAAHTLATPLRHDWLDVRLRQAGRSGKELGLRLSWLHRGGFRAGWLLQRSAGLLLRRLWGTGGRCWMC